MLRSHTVGGSLQQIAIRPVDTVHYRYVPYDVRYRMMHSALLQKHYRRPLQNLSHGYEQRFRGQFTFDIQKKRTFAYSAGQSGYE